MLRRILVANRGEIAARIVLACQRLGIETVLAASEADLDSRPARLADRTICLGPPPAAASYLNVAAVVAAAAATGCDAIHPGYGFLAENPALARACAAAGLVFIGPAAVQLLGDGERVIHLSDRDCSIQRRYQKVIEEAPAPLLADGLRTAIHDAAVAFGSRLGYRGLGTVEFLVAGGEELHRAQAPVAEPGPERDGGIVDRRPQAVGQQRRRCLLDHLLVPPLDRAVPVGQVDDPFAVAEELDLDVPGSRQEAFQVDPRVAERACASAAA